MIYLCLFCDPEDTIPPCEGEIGLAFQIEANSPEDAAQKLALGDRAGLSEYHVLVSASGSNDWKMYAVLTTVTVKVVPV